MKKYAFFILLFCTSLLLFSCSVSRQYSPAYDAAVLMNEASESGKQYASLDKFFSDEEIRIERKIIYSAYLSLTVKNLDTARVRIERTAEKYEGYVNEAGTYKIIIRVKSDQLDDAIKEITCLGKLQHKNITGQDVTEAYADHQIRLENAQTARSRYLELLAKAENVEAALLVEKELERLNETIELLKGKMNRINHLEAFATITVKLTEKKKPGVLGYIGMGLYHSVKWLFVRN